MPRQLGLSPPQELEVGPHSGPYLLVWFKSKQCPYHTIPVRTLNYIGTQQSTKSQKFGLKNTLGNNLSCKHLIFKFNINASQLQINISGSATGSTALICLEHLFIIFFNYAWNTFLFLFFVKYFNFFLEKKPLGWKYTCILTIIFSFPTTLVYQDADQIK